VPRMTISLCFRLMSMLVLLVMKLLYCAVQHCQGQSSTVVSKAAGSTGVSRYGDENSKRSGLRAWLCYQCWCRVWARGHTPSPCWLGRRLRCRSQSLAHQTPPAQNGCRGHSTAQHNRSQRRIHA
jgi:hypothetical protein